MLLIEKEFSGLDKDININYLESKWCFSDKEYNLNYLLALEKIDSIKSVELKYRKMLSMINTDNKHAYSVLGKNRISENLKEIKNKINEFKLRFNKRYEVVFNIRQDLVSKISTSFIDDKEYELPIYDNYSSVTGRTKITSGYNFLVMKKEDRKNITSRYKNGRVYEIDIVYLRNVLHTVLKPFKFGKNLSACFGRNADNRSHGHHRCLVRVQAFFFRKKTYLRFCASGQFLKRGILAIKDQIVFFSLIHEYPFLSI